MGTIFYFTGTGNSLKIARDLSDQLDQAEVVFIPDVIGEDEIKTDSDLVGIVYPVYMFGQPLIVSQFIKKLVVRRDTYVFMVANYAGMAGGAFEQTRRELKAQGIALASSFGIMMPSNYTPMGGAQSEAKQKELFEREEKKVKKIAGLVKAGIEWPFEKPFILSQWIGGLLYKMFAPRIPALDKDFWVNDTCSSCRLCEKMCPVDNITVENGRPKWMGRCQQCMACLQWCPKEAIQYGKHTVGKKRYHQAEVKSQDIMRNSGREA